MNWNSDSSSSSNEKFQIELSEIQVERLESLMKLSRSVVKPKPAEFEVKIKPLMIEEATCHLETINVDSDSICGICGETINLTDICWQLTCSHYLHKECLKQWFRYDDAFSCPICRQSQLYQESTARIFYRN